MVFEHQLCRQYRCSSMGREGLDLNVWLPVIRERGWNMARSLKLLAQLESALMAPVEKPEPDRSAPSNVRIH